MKTSNDFLKSVSEFSRQEARPGDCLSPNDRRRAFMSELHPHGASVNVDVEVTKWEVGW